MSDFKKRPSRVREISFNALDYQLGTMVRLYSIGHEPEEWTLVGIPSGTKWERSFPSERSKKWAEKLVKSRFGEEESEE